MTERPNDKLSLYDERASTVAGALGLAAATAAVKVSRLLTAAKQASSLSSKEIASKLGITEGRVSQVLTGDGNVHIATAGRFLRAMGYELTVSAVPVEPGRNILNLGGRRSRRKAAMEAEKSFELYVQTFLTHEGPVKVPMVVPAHDTLRTTPHGGPAQIATLRVSSGGRARPMPLKRGSWQTNEVEVHSVGT